MKNLKKVKIPFRDVLGSGNGLELSLLTVPSLQILTTQVLFTLSVYFIFRVVMLRKVNMFIFEILILWVFSHSKKKKKKAQPPCYLFVPINPVY